MTATQTGRRLGAETTGVLAKMNDLYSDDTLDGQALSDLQHHERLGAIYKWVYDNGNPDQGPNPDVSYIRRMQESLRNMGIEMTGDALAWIHFEIYQGRWRPGRYAN